MEAESHLHYVSKACHTLEFSHSFIVRRFEKNLIWWFSVCLNIFFYKKWNNLGEMNFTNVYYKVQRNKQVSIAHWNFCLPVLNFSACLLHCKTVSYWKKQALLKTYTLFESFYFSTLLNVTKANKTKRKYLILWHRLHKNSYNKMITINKRLLITRCSSY